MTPSRVVVLRALGLGDLMAAVPALRGLRSAFPGAGLVLACPPGVGALMAGSGLCDGVIPVGPLDDLPGGLGADLAVNMHGSGPQSHRLMLAAGLRPLIAHRCVPVWPDGPVWDAAAHERVRWCRLLRHPGAAAGARRRPADRFASAARAAAVHSPVFVTGSADEVPLARAAAGGAGLSPGCILAGRTGLPALASLVAGARAVVSGNTGVAHLAAAVGTPTVTVFGPTPPGLWGPPATPGTGSCGPGSPVTRAAATRGRAFWRSPPGR